jgi:serine-type D-Ala-D-Ala carboxypeptidase (penicillin-binding protein 5/6)
MKSACSACLALLALAVFALAPARAQTFDTAAPHAILIEAETGEVLFEKNADAPFPPASMAKMMTVYIAFDLIHKSDLKLADTTQVSTEAWRKWRLQGSTMFLKAGDTVTIEDLIRGIIVHSGNDATAVLAEALAGSESAFVDWMNDKAAEIGMTNTVFHTTNGWPSEGQQVTARDLATLALRTAEDFPELYSYYDEKSFTYGIDPQGSPITQTNRNPVLYNVEGGDGLKTGHTEEAGYGLTGSAARDGRRVVVVVSGLTSERQRSSEAQRLMEYAFRNFKTYKLFAAGQVIENAPVWLGKEGAVPMVLEKDVAMTIGRMERNRMVAKVVYDSPVPAPIEAGQAIGRIVVSIPDREDRVIPLVAGKAVEEVGPFGRIGALFSYLIFGASAASGSQ